MRFFSSQYVGLQCLLVESITETLQEPPNTLKTVAIELLWPRNEGHYSDKIGTTTLLRWAAPELEEFKARPDGSPGQPDLVAGNPVHSRGSELDDL